MSQQAEAYMAVHK